MVETRACEACSAAIFFVEGPNGKKIPLDFASNKHIYVVAPDINGEQRATHVVGGVYISHFRTCRDPGRFGGAR